MQTIKPTGNNIFAKPDEAETKTKSGILLSESAVEKPKMASVINIGDEVKHIKPKDRIVYKSYTTSEIKLNDVEYFLVAEEDILGHVVEVSE
jgi:chaperonin GroES